MTFDDAVALFQKLKKADRTLDVKVLRPKNEVIAEFNKKLDEYWQSVLDANLKEKFAGKEGLVLQILKGVRLNEVS
ncbi:hypothetical protein [Campylobacter concisus]